MRLSDTIEEFIKMMMAQDEEEIELKRNELAEYFSCAPSQINYVLSTRFTPDHGYVIESRRGGGGCIRVIRLRRGSGEMINYLLSERMLQDVDSRFNLDEVYAPRGADFFFGLTAALPIEEKLSYWQRMITVNFDTASGILQLQVRAFDPLQAQEIAQFILARCEVLINDLSTTAHNESLKLAKQEIAIAEKRLTDARMALREFRDVSQDVDPVEGAKLAVKLVAGMEQELAKLNADLEIARSQMAEDTPRIRVIKSQISALASRIEAEKQRLGSGTTDAKTARTTQDLIGSDVSGRLQLYEKLELEREFGERTYAAALASLEKARLDATGKQRYLAVFIQPTLSQMAQYPQRFLHALMVFLAGMFAWGMATLVYYNIRDRA